MEYTFGDIIHDSWEQLTNAGNQQQNGFRNITIANYAADSINAYTVVLRKAIAVTRTLLFYTDLRTPKVKEFKDNNAVTVLAYDNDQKIQLLLKGFVSVHRHNDTALECWKANGYKSRKSYLSEPAPSAPADRPTDGLNHLSGKNFDDTSMDGYENFAVGAIEVHVFEWVKLNREGNRRARFTLDKNQQWQGQWLIP